jgi:hypothetical protein
MPGTRAAIYLTIAVNQRILLDKSLTRKLQVADTSLPAAF